MLSKYRLFFPILATVQQCHDLMGDQRKGCKNRQFQPLCHIKVYRPEGFDEKRLLGHCKLQQKSNDTGSDHQLILQMVYGEKDFRILRIPTA